MAVTITASDVKAGYATAIPDAEIALMIAVVDEANTCLDANLVADDKQTLLKVLGVRHMLAMMESDGRGKATSEQAPSGAGRSFGQWQGQDASATRYGAMLKQLDQFGCVTKLLENTQRLQIRSVGRRDPCVERPTYGG